MGEVEDLLAALVEANCLREDYVTRQVSGKQRSYKSVALTPRGWEVMQGKGEELLMRVQHGKKLIRGGAKSKSAMAIVSSPLLEALRQVRTRLAREADVPAYVVATDRTLDDLARLAPASVEALRHVHGLGDKRIERYGAAFLDAIRATGVKPQAPSAIDRIRLTRPKAYVHRAWGTTGKDA
jgi:superfamily II DNA helicase RecQ